MKCQVSVFKIGERYTWMEGKLTIESVPVQTKAASLRAQAAAQLAKATTDGRLAAALSKIRAPKLKTEMKCQVSVFKLGEQYTWTEGRLTIESMPVQTKAASLCAQAAVQLAKATTDGRLAAALS